MRNLGDLIADLSSGNSDRAENAAIELRELGSTAIDALKPLLQSDLADQRWWATRALSGSSHLAAGELLLSMLDDPDRGVRHCAALALSQHPHPAALPKLISSLTSNDTMLARLAANALAATGSDAVEPLIGMLDPASPNARVEAARALALIGDTRAIPELFKLLDSESIVLQHWANEGLDKMGVGMSFFKP